MYDYEEFDGRNMKGNLRDWRKALRTPAPYRVGNTVRIQPQFVYFFVLIGGLVLLLSYYNWWTSHQTGGMPSKWSNAVRPYNTTYPLTPPVKTGDEITFRIGIIADLDTNSKSHTQPDTYISYYRRGYLTYNPAKKHVKVTWDIGPAVALTSKYAYKGRGMELSELIVYDGRLLAFDDRSGLVFEIINHKKVIPWVILPHGDGQTEHGFKTEWATIKDEILYAGSMGKEWTTSSGKFENYDPMWVKAINIQGQVQHLSWVKQYVALRGAIDIEWPGYMIHESAAWSDIKQLWYFLPRKCSFLPYNETRDEVMGCNYLITADNDFKTIHALKIAHDPKRGFSSFKFIPGTKDNVLIALKTTEYKGETTTFITAFTTKGEVLLEDTLVDNLKYEGIEFI